jgi:hypothetical protein
VCVYIYIFLKKMKNYIFFLIRVKNTRCQKYCFKKEEEKNRSVLSFFFFFFLPNTYTIYLATRNTCRTYQLVVHLELAGGPVLTERERERERESERQRQRERERERASKRRREGRPRGGRESGRWSSIDGERERE